MKKLFEKTPAFEPKPKAEKKGKKDETLNELKVSAIPFNNVIDDEPVFGGSTANTVEGDGSEGKQGSE